MPDFTFTDKYGRELTFKDYDTEPSISEVNRGFLRQFPESPSDIERMIEENRAQHAALEQERQSVIEQSPERQIVDVGYPLPLPGGIGTIPSPGIIRHPIREIGDELFFL